jgi:cytidylate kinase
MSTRSGHSFGTDSGTAEAVLKAALYSFSRANRHGGAKPVVRAYVTVSRQPGASAHLFSHRLAERLNGLPGGDWTAWDNELFDKVSSEHAIEKQVLEAIEERPNSWLDEFVRGITVSGGGRHASELFAYQRIAMTIRALAKAGHTVLVGRGSQFVTAGVPGGIHVRLVAPLEHRIQSVAKKYDISTHQAAARVEEADQNRKIFYRRYWPGREMKPESFAMTLNVAELSVDELVECVLPLIRMRDDGGSAGRKDAGGRSGGTADLLPSAVGQ